jgi:hypothetical protein
MYLSIKKNFKDKMKKNLEENFGSNLKEVKHTKIS